MFEFVLTSNLITSNACKSSLELWTTSQFLHTPLKLLRRGNKYGYPHAVILHLSHGFKLSFKKSWFLWGFQLFIWKIINIWIHICVKHRKLCYIYEIIAKKAKKERTFATEKCTIHQIDKNENLANGTFFSSECSLFLHFLLYFHKYSIISYVLHSYGQIGWICLGGP